MSTAQRVIPLDILRGLACIIVVASHSIITLSSLASVGSAVAYWAGFGGKGVFLFFIVSGFVIRMTLEHIDRPMDFVVSRFSRLFPAYWTAVILTFIAIYFLYPPQPPISLKAVFANMTMMQSFMGFEDLNKVYWTLKIEMIFYAWMLFVYMTNNLKILNRLLFVPVILSIIFSVCGLAFEHSPVYPLLNELFILDHIHWFVFGILFYRLYRERQLCTGELGVLLLNMGAMALRSYAVDNAFINLAVVAVFLTILFLNITGPGVFRFFGSISYSLYLVHVPIGHILFPKLTSLNLLLNITITFLTMIGIASLITYAIEKPALKAIRALYSSRRRR